MLMCMNLLSRSFFVGLAAGLFLTLAVLAGAIADRIWGLELVDRFVGNLPSGIAEQQTLNEHRVVLTEESVVTDVVEKWGPSVVTVGIKTTERFLQRDPFMDPFGMFFQQPKIGERQIERDIGSGFIVSEDGLIVTNKHVVNDMDAEYQVFTQDGKEYTVEKIDRDPLNDLAILKINATGLVPLQLGDSTGLKVGQFVIAIGTALGEFRNTVTTGVISGLGRGIVAGDAFSRSAEELDNVIQTDAAINPGNSGGPLLNTSGQVIGVSVAVAQGGQNIGFALPVNLLKTGLEEFTQRGGFGTRAFFGVRYFMISRQAALANDVPQGAYVEEVVANSPAAKAGIREGDVVLTIAGQSLKDVEGGLAAVVSQKRTGDVVDVEYWRDGNTQTVQVTLEAGQ